MSGKVHFSEYDSCRLCPRECGVNRNAGEKGFCGMGSELRIASMLPHFGEEPCLSGTCGSGTVFFSGCSCGCFFCQNHQISGEGVGRVYSFDGFVEALRALTATGVHNLNFVTPEHFMPAILAACRILRDEGNNLPFLWNSSGYAKKECIAEAAEIIDVFMPDFKFADRELARLCMNDAGYCEHALAAIGEMVDRAGFLRPWDDTGEIVASRGTIVRHLVLPGRVDNSILALELLYNNFGPMLPISIMSQFMPMPECGRRGMLDRKVTENEYMLVCEYAEELGFEKMFVQMDNGDDGFAPDFTKDNPFDAAGAGQKPVE